MNAREYQEKANAFASYGENAMYPALGLAEEAGEVCGKVAKFIRKHDGIAPATADEDSIAMDYDDQNGGSAESLGKTYEYMAERLAK